MTGNRAGRRVSADPLYEKPRQTAVRLTTTVPIVNRLIKDKMLPARPINGSRKIPKVATGLLLASAYEIWPEACRPRYTAEELRRLAGITIEEVSAQMGLGRSAGYEAVQKRQIPAKQLPNTDRWVVPEDAAARMEAYDLKTFTRMSLPEKMQPLKQRRGRSSERRRSTAEVLDW